jgi:hypothetical protein
MSRKLFEDSVTKNITLQQRDALLDGDVPLLSSETVNEVSSNLLHKYVKKAKKSVDKLMNGSYSDDKDNKVFKRKMYISFAQHSKLHEETDNIIRHPEHKKSYVSSYKNGYKASNKHGNVKFFNEHGKKSAYKHAEIELKEEQLDELSATTLLNYRDKARKSKENHEISAMTWDEIAADKGHKLNDKTFERTKMDYHDNKAISREKGIKKAGDKLRKKNVIPFKEALELIEKQDMTVSYRAAVRRRDTEKRGVRHRRNQRMHHMVDNNRAQYVMTTNFKPRNGDPNQLIDRQKHQKTDRWRNQRLYRLSLLHKNKNLKESYHVIGHVLKKGGYEHFVSKPYLTKSQAEEEHKRLKNSGMIHGEIIDTSKIKGLEESALYLKNRQLLHDAHAQAGREIGKRERDPELKRIHMHRSRKHAHAAKVLEIISNSKKKKK